MIWLASFPRSGNTFFRNVLFEVYGIESSTFHKETTYPVDDNYELYQVVKTHLLPSQLEPKDPSIKSVYIVRDGRDALVSIAHHRKDLVSANSDFQINLLEAIIAPNGSHFGGWSENVRQWTEKADIVIRFQDLIDDPIRELEKLRGIMDLPEPQRDKLPSFDKLKFGTPEYGSAKKYLKSNAERLQHSGKSFRKGKVGGWKDEMSPEIETLFWQAHGDIMLQMGYGRDIKPTRRKLAMPKSPYKVLIEANKLFMDGNDGIKRYQVELLNGLAIFQDLFPEKWDIDLYVEGGVFIKIKDRGKQLEKVRSLQKEREEEKAKHNAEIEDQILHGKIQYENTLLHLKTRVSEKLPSPIYNVLSWVYRILPIRFFLKCYRSWIAKRVLERIDEIRPYDLVHIPLPQNFQFLKDAKSRFIVTVHDLTHRSFPEFHTADNIQYSEEGMQEILKKDAHLIAISEATKRDIVNDYPSIKDEGVTVIYEACNRSHFRPSLDDALRKSVLEKYDLPDCPYFLTLSTIEPRKNLLNTVKAFEQLIGERGGQDLALFICGKKGWKTEELFQSENINSRNIFFTGFVDEEDLPVLYSNGLALCYVSIYEGFGLPPLEAMACGTSVLYGDNSSMPEVIGNAGIAANPLDVDDIKSKMNLFLDEASRKDLNEKSIIRAHQFSWLKTAWETLNLYEKCIKKK